MQDLRNKCVELMKALFLKRNCQIDGEDSSDADRVSSTNLEPMDMFAALVDEPDNFEIDPARRVKAARHVLTLMSFEDLESASLVMLKTLSAYIESAYDNSSLSDTAPEWFEEPAFMKLLLFNGQFTELV